MKKKILTLALAAFALCAVPASARSNNNNSADARKAPRTEQTCNNNNQCRQGKRPNQNRQGQRPDLFQGIQLTPEQQTALQALDQQRASQRTDSAARAQQRQGNQRPDSAAMAQRRQARLDSRRSYLDGVKNILTPEQYVVYLENCYMMQPGRKAPQQNIAGRDNNNSNRREGNVRRGHDNSRRDSNRHASVNSSQMRHSASLGNRK